ncbi:MAG: hypothetical protein LKJ99_01570 [Acidaminococcaceae bacterium]|jgi:hypothetical protein|nr:hypothetical protein [Acidaminococcaceae bacterium]MCI2109646.1 hypothetical protein [Acidaminococcaceae bacterium]
MDFISRVAASKMATIKTEIADLKEKLAATHDETKRKTLKKRIRENETYYEILAERLRVKTRF